MILSLLNDKNGKRGDRLPGTAYFLFTSAVGEKKGVAEISLQKRLSALPGSPDVR